MRTFVLLSAAALFFVAIYQELPPASRTRGEDRPVVVSDEQIPSKSAQKTGAQPAAKPALKANDRPVAQVAEKAPAKPGDKGALKEPTLKGPAVKTAAPDKNAADDEAIRKASETYARAYNAGDAPGVAAHYTPDAEYVDERGNLFEGRQAIEESLTAFFAENPGYQLDFDVNTIRFVSPGVAVEDGTTTVTHPEGASTGYSHYTTVYVKTAGKWLAASSRERSPKDRREHSVQLQQLDWLVGDWVDEGDDAIVDFSCQAVDNGNFLLRQFTVKIAGREEMSGTQRTGWDPLTGKLRAWTFDSEGGYGEGTWHRDGNSWVLKSTGVTADGQTASGTGIYTIVNEHTMTWQAVDHEIEGVRLPDGDVFTLVRKPPVPLVLETPE